MTKEQHKLFNRIVFFADLLLIIISLLLAYFLRDNVPVLSAYELLPLAHVNYYLGLLPILLIIWGGLLYYFGMYESFYVKLSKSLIIILKTALIGFVLFGSYIFVLRMQQEVSRLVIFFTFLFSVILLSLDKIALFYVSKYLWKRDESFYSALISFRRILVIGTGRRAQQFVSLIKQNPGWGMKVIGMIDKNPDKKGKEISGYKILGSFKDVPEIVHENIIDETLFIVPRSWLDSIENIIRFCESEGIKVNIAADLYDFDFSKIKFTNFHGIPLFTFSSTTDKFGHLFLKRIFDFVFACLGLLLLSVFFVFVSVMIKLSTRGPVFYSQLRCGLYGRQFNFYKFRTMVVDADAGLKDLMKYNEMNGPVFKMTNDPRVTSVGKLLRKFSIDELPQLWNVIKGDMSLVGPRPPLPREVEKYTPCQRRRLSMRPGITCLWQISGRSKISDFNRWLELDLEYIDSWSFLLDLKIILRSIPVVLLGKGIV